MLCGCYIENGIIVITMKCLHNFPFVFLRFCFIIAICLKGCIVCILYLQLKPLVFRIVKIKKLFCSYLTCVFIKFKNSTKDFRHCVYVFATQYLNGKFFMWMKFKSKLLGIFLSLTQNTNFGSVAVYQRTHLDISTA